MKFRFSFLLLIIQSSVLISCDWFQGPCDSDGVSIDFPCEFDLTIEKGPKFREYQLSNNCTYRADPTKSFKSLQFRVSYEEDTAYFDFDYANHKVMEFEVYDITNLPNEEWYLDEEWLTKDQSRYRVYYRYYKFYCE